MENNGYAVSTTVAEATGEPRLSARALGFGITAWRVDGMDPLAVHLAMERAAARLRAGEGPVVIEALVYRFFHQNGPYPGSAFGYRTKEEEAAWRARDPLDRVAREMTKLGLIDEAGVAAVRAQAVAGDAGGRRRAHRARPVAGRQGRARGASARSCGQTRRSSTSASAATCRSWPGRAPPSARRSPGRSGAGSSSRRCPR